MDTYDVVEMDQDRIEISKVICTIYHLQDDDKQDVMESVETDKQLYLLYQAPYQ